MTALLPARRLTRHVSFAWGSPPPGQGAGPGRRAGARTAPRMVPGAPSVRLRWESRDPLANPPRSPETHVPYATESRPSAGRVVAVVSGAVAGLVAFSLVRRRRRSPLRQRPEGPRRLRLHRQRPLPHPDVRARHRRSSTSTPTAPTGSTPARRSATSGSKATSRDGKPVFVGIAPTKDVDALPARHGARDGHRRRLRRRSTRPTAPAAAAGPPPAGRPALLERVGERQRHADGLRGRSAAATGPSSS